MLDNQPIVSGTVARNPLADEPVSSLGCWDVDWLDRISRNLQERYTAYDVRDEGTLCRLQPAIPVMPFDGFSHLR